MATSYDSYEIGFAAEVGWRAKRQDPEAIPPFDYVEEVLTMRLRAISEAVGATERGRLYLTEGKTFRDEIATTKPYKGTRKDKKPWHYKNLSAYMKGVLEAQVVTGIEADDQLAIDHLANPKDTIICTRDKDLKQVPGWVYSWELGEQPSFGPVKISHLGGLELVRRGKQPVLKGTGFKWFCGQMLVGDATDNIPGCPKVGPVKAYELLEDLDDCELCLENVQQEYDKVLGVEGEVVMLEMGQLLWMTRRLNPDGSPQLWYPGLYE